MTDAFKTYDFSSDSKWKAIERSLEFPAQMSAATRQAKLQKRKLKFYKAEIDPAYEPPAASSSSSGQQARPQQQQHQQEQQQGPSSGGGTYGYGYGYGSGAQFATPPQKFFASKKITVAMNYIALCAALFTIPQVVLFLFNPAKGFSLVMLGSGVQSFALLVAKHGFPKLQKAYFQDIVATDQALFLLSTVILMTAPPHLVVAAPGFLRAIQFTAQSLHVLLARYVPRIHARVRFLLDKVNSNPMHIAMLHCNMEIFVIVLLIVSVFSNGISAFISVYLYSQYLQARYRQSAQLQSAFTQLRTSLDGYLESPRCPGIITRGYGAAKAAIWKVADPNRHAQQAASGGPKPKCTIM